jgi:hypothetical protein
MKVSALSAQGIHHFNGLDRLINPDEDVAAYWILSEPVYRRGGRFKDARTRVKTTASVVMASPQGGAPGTV